MNDFNTFTIIAYLDNLEKIIVATCFEWLAKVQKIARSGHTEWHDQRILTYVLFKGKYHCTADLLFDLFKSERWNI